MMGYCYEPGVTSQEVEAALRSLSLREAGDVPVLGIEPGAAGGDGKVLFASRSMLALFGSRDLEALSGRLRANGGAGPRRLYDLAASLAEDGGPRLERLRFFLGPAAQTFTFLCRKITRAAGDERRPPILVAAALGVKVPPVRTIADERPQLTPGGLMVQAVAAAAAPAQVLTLDQVRAALAPRFGTVRTVRFLWRTDGTDKITQITPPLAEIVGAAAADLLGRDFGDVANYLHLDPDGRLARAFTRRETWSGLEVLWPIAGAAAAVPVSLGGLPAYDRDGGFDGYRGFGVIHLERLAAAEPQRLGAQEAPAAMMPAPIAANVVLLRPLAATDRAGPAAQAALQGREAAEGPALSTDERRAFEQIAVALSGEDRAAAIAAPAEPVSAGAAPRETSPQEAPSQEAPTQELSSKESSPQESSPQESLVQESSVEEASVEESSLQGPSVQEFAANQTPADEAPAEEAAAQAAVAQAAVAGEDVAEEVTTQGATEEEALAEPMPHPAEMALPAAAEHQQAPVARAEWLAQNGVGANATNILDRLGQGLLVSRDDVPIYINRYLLDLLGYLDEDAFHAAGGMARMFEHPPSTGGGTLNLRTAAGAVVAVQARMQAIEWDQLPATLLTLRRDEEQGNDARARLEAALSERENNVRELDAILDTATDGLATIDAQGRILTLNRSGEALFGYDQSDIAGQPFTILLAPECEARARDYFEGLQKNGVASLLNDGREFVGRPRQGGAIPIFMTLGRVSPGREGAAEQKFCALLRDLTHWKKVEQDLLEARKEAERASALKSDFLARVSHEIRTPLNAILGFAEVIMEERFGPIGNERYRDYIKDIHASGGHVMSLVNDLLDLSKIEAGKMELAFASVDANRVISECVSIMQPQANRERVIMRLALAPQLPKIMADERSLRQIILNLLSNAVKFNEPGGQVIIASGVTDAGNAVIRIRDTGIGMSDQDIETALEPFRQLATSRPTTGTGLGLPLTKALIEANRASLTIKSKKTEGTLVEVTFPATRVVPA